MTMAPTELLPVPVKSAKGGIGNRHVLVNSGAEIELEQAPVTEAERLVASRRRYAREQEGVMRLAQSGAARTEMTKYCAVIQHLWPYASTVSFAFDDENESIAVALHDANGDLINYEGSDGLAGSPSDVADEYDIDYLRRFSGEMFNVSDAAADYRAGGGPEAARAHERNSAWAIACIAKAEMADYFTEIAAGWPDAATATFKEDICDGEAVQVELAGAGGVALIGSTGGAQDLLDSTFDYASSSRYIGQTINIRELAVWDPYAPAAGDA